MKQEELKRMAAEAAAREVNSGEIVGLGTGSTTYYAIKYLGERTKDEGLGIIGIPTSRATEKIARESGIPLGTFEEYQEIDIAIDGADQVDHRLNLIKGGGGAHVREKIVASTAKRFLVVVDETKVSKELNIPVPVEVLPYATGLVIKRLEAMGATSLLRLSKKDYFISDNGNYVLDADFGTIEEPKKLEQDINRIKGVVDNGIFAGYRPEVYVGTKSGVEVFHF
ncbi:MAG: ribose-5-phosphate isomerase RpiA [Methanobacteriota archaeon]|nr:MAG: ribose-5-phosphate isomerase RpiA [Euryarchaeota archaeon]